MEDSPYQALGLPRVINAAGKMTALGGSAQSEEVAAAQAQAARAHVDIGQLRQLAGRVIAERTGAEAASVTTGAAAGIAIGVAALITGSDKQAIERLPDSGDLAAGILLQAGHDVHFGARVVQMIRLGGGKPELIGTSDRVTAEDLEAAIRASAPAKPAGLLFVQSHHTRQTAGLELAEMVAIGRRHAIPVLVDAAAEQDLECFVAAGADLVTYSGGKAIGGPTVGFIAGRRDLVEACEAQTAGIARAMKVGKEQIVGLLAALDNYPAAAAWPERLNALREELADLKGVNLSIEPDLAGRAIERLGVRFDSVAAARTFVAALRAGDPAIYSRNHLLDEGLVLFDLREVQARDLPLLGARLRTLLDTPLESVQQEQ